MILLLYTWAWYTCSLLGPLRHAKPWLVCNGRKYISQHPQYVGVLPFWLQCHSHSIIVGCLLKLVLIAFTSDIIVASSSGSFNQSCYIFVTHLIFHLFLLMGSVSKIKLNGEVLVALCVCVLYAYKSTWTYKSSTFSRLCHIIMKSGKEYVTLIVNLTTYFLELWLNAQFN